MAVVAELIDLLVGRMMNLGLNGWGAVAPVGSARQIAATKKMETSEDVLFSDEIPAVEILSTNASSPKREATRMNESVAAGQVVDEEVSLKGSCDFSSPIEASKPEALHMAMAEGEMLFRSPRKPQAPLQSQLAGVSSSVLEDEVSVAYRNLASKQRKSEEDIHPYEAESQRHKQQRTETEPANLSIETKSLVAETTGLVVEPAKPGLVRSLSRDIEDRVASIQVSPSRKPIAPVTAAATIGPITKSPTTSAALNDKPNSPMHSARSMSPIRCAAAPNTTTQFPSTSPTRVPDSTAPWTPSATLLSPTNRLSLQANDKEELYETVHRDVEQKFSRQIEFLQYEISSLQEKYETSLQTNAETRATLSEYERTLAQFIDARRTRPDQHSSPDQLVQEKKKLELEIQTLQISFQNLHQRYEDIKGLHEQSRINEATLRQTITMLQQELAAVVRNLDSTRKSYEERLERANVEGVNVKATLENELSAAKAKLLKSELRIVSLESAVDAKTRENSELMTICDELIKKMDNKK